jgi:hypothetical protein
VEQGKLNISNVSMAPDLPGLYAWYAEVRLGQQDWMQKLQDDEDLGESRLREALDAFSYLLARQRLSVEASSHFSTKWRGVLEEFISSRVGSANTANFATTLSSPARRELLVSIISTAAPVFAHPLYIGVADSLKTRLRQHSDEFFSLREAQRESPAAFEGYASEQNFAQRAFRLGLKQEHLSVYFTPIKIEGDLDRLAIRETLEAAEGLLNRWSMPLLGRK